MEKYWERKEREREGERERERYYILSGWNNQWSDGVHGKLLIDLLTGMKMMLSSLLAGK